MQVVSCEERAARAEADLRVEREWRNSLQEKEVLHKEEINSLQIHIRELISESRVIFKIF